MNIVKAASDWAKAEIVSAQIFIFFGLLFMIGSAIFWQLGATELTESLINPILVAGALLVAAGIGFYFSNNKRLANFESDYKNDPTMFIKSEIERTERRINSYETVAFKVFPAIILVAAILICFIDSSFWRGISIAIIAFFLVLILLDRRAHARTKVYHEQLKLAQH